MKEDNATVAGNAVPRSPLSPQEVQALQNRVAECKAAEKQLRSRIAELEAQDSALQGKQKNLATLFKALPDLAFVLDREGHYVDVLTGDNHPLLYRPPAEMEGRSQRDILPRRVAEPALTCIQQALETGETQTLEYWLDVPAGRIWFEGRIAPMETPDAPNGLVIWLSRDITARKKAKQALYESQQRYALAASAGRVGIWEYRLATDTLYLDPHAQSLLGHAHDVLEDWQSILRPQDVKTLVSRAKRHLEGHAPAFDCVCQVQRRDQPSLWMLIRGSAIHKEESKAAVLIGTLTDITEGREAEIARERLLIALQRRNAQMQTAAEVSSAISSILDPEKLTQQVVDLIRQGFDLYYVGLFLVDRTGLDPNEPGKWALLRAGTGNVGQRMVEEKHKLEIGGPSMIGWCIANQKARISLDVGTEAVRFENPWLPKTRSELALPLVSRGETIGALTIQSDEKTAFRESDITVLQAMADQLANAIINARLYEQAQQEIAERRWVEASLRQRQRELELLNSASRALTKPLDLDEVLSTMLSRVQQILGVIACSVWLINDEKANLVCRQATGSQHEKVLGWTLKLGQGVAGLVADVGEGMIVNDTSKSDHYFAGVAEEIGLDVRATLCVPLLIKEEVIGVLQVIDTETNRFQPSELRLMESLAATAAIAIDNARLYEQAQQDAATKSALLDEANHRVKNNLSAIMGILALELQKSYDRADDFRALLRDLLARIQGMSTVHSLLSETRWTPLSLKRLIEEIIHSALSGSPISHRIQMYIHAPSTPLVIAPRQATNLAVLLNELTTNSIKHAFQDRKQGKIDVDIQVVDEEKREIVLRYYDNGPGWPESVLKGTSSGVGMRLMHLIAQGPMLDELVMENNNGAVATLRFRLVPFP